MSCSRREFLKTGGMLAGAALIPGAALLESFSPKELTLQWVLDHFKVTENELRKVMAIAMENGGDYADIFFEHTLDSMLVLRDGKVNSTSSNIDFGVGIRVIKGDQTGYAYTENVAMSEMIKAARTAAKIANGITGIKTTQIKEFPLKKNYYNVISSWEETTVKTKMPFLQKVNDKIFSLDKRVSRVIVSQTDSTSYILFFNSDGVLMHDYRPMGTLGATCIMEQKGKIENGRSARAYRMGAEFLTDDLVETISQEAVKQTALMFDAIKPKGGEMPVVMGAGGSGILLHEAIGHAFEADFNRKNTSIFADKLGKKVCDASISVLDDGTIPFNRGAVNMDDEGVLGQKTYIVKDGVLNSYLHDRISAKHYGVAPTGNGRRQSFRFTPVPRMRATYMENGNAREEDIIASVKRGIFVDNFTNGQVQIGAGDFTFFVKSGYLIEDGKLTRPIKDINIIGNGPKALADITMVANNYKMDNGTWTCGKDGQSCPVTCGMPSVLVSKLTVGGENA
jgi:TldD protein